LISVDACHVLIRRDYAYAAATIFAFVTPPTPADTLPAMPRHTITTPAHRLNAEAAGQH